ncbi:MAG TPA: sulfite oxidase [Propionibacteriaceae bacterium]|nr:sulfite oxidase [Propionibacteriaceae bacterium]
MTIDLESISSPARVASPEEGISADELRLAARNHGMPLESLHWDITPAGLHYLLIHYDIPAIDPTTFELVIDGVVGSPLSLDLDAIRSRPKVTAVVTLECAGNGRARLLPRPVSQPWLTEAVGTARWSGTPLLGLLQEAGIAEEAVDVVFTGADHGIERGLEQDYQRALPVTEALREDVLLAYEMNGAPLPPQHGAPLRLVVPGWYGMAHVKWLRRITLVAQPFDGFQMRAYRLRDTPDEPGVPVTRIEPRALLVPPGFPDFMSRRRVVRSGPVRIEGRAWSGWAPVSKVEVSIDGGDTWEPADLERAQASHGWARWTWTWQSELGSYVLACRATDASGRTQPLGQRWSRGGFANNTIQRVPVIVISSEM